MSKLLSISIDVTKLDKSRFYEGKNGAKYCSLDVWVGDEPDQYGRDASVSESLTRDERDAGTKKNYVGSGKKLYGWGSSGSSARKPANKPAPVDPVQEEVPF